MKHLDYYNSFWYRFTKPLKRLWFRYLLSRNKLIKVDERHHGIGKTYMTIDRAMKLNIPIIVGSQKEIDMVKRFANTVEVYGFARNFTAKVLNQSFPDGVLIDDSVDPELISLLESQFTIRGGFIQGGVNKNGK